MDESTIAFRSSEIHYWHSGQGRELFLCFHGYGESGRNFQLLETMGLQNTGILAPDMPFHGATQWREGQDLEVEDWLRLMDKIIERHYPHIQQINLLGYSMGGRIAMSLYALKPRRFKRVILLATDGLHVNFWYRLATHNSIGNRIFRFSMQHPGGLIGLLRAGKKLHLLNSSIYKFVQAYCRDREVRMDLYKRWTCMRKFRPDLDQIKILIRQHHTSVQLVYGKYDRIILSEHGDRFREGIEAFCSIHLIDCGHQVLQARNNAVLLRILHP